MDIDPAKVFVVSIMRVQLKSLRRVRNYHQPVTGMLTLFDNQRACMNDKESGHRFYREPERHFVSMVSFGASCYIWATGGVMEAALRTCFGNFKR
jgi:hypothetical protein